MVFGVLHSALGEEERSRRIQGATGVSRERQGIGDWRLSAFGPFGSATMFIFILFLLFFLSESRAVRILSQKSACGGRHDFLVPRVLNVFAPSFRFAHLLPQGVRDRSNRQGYNGRNSCSGSWMSDRSEFCNEPLVPPG